MSRAYIVLYARVHHFDDDILYYVAWYTRVDSAAGGDK